MDVNSLVTAIDVSRWQGRINWSFVAKNIPVAMIKIGGSDDGFYQDGMAYYNVINARQEGVACGFYYFLGGVFSPREEGEHIIQVINLIGGLRAGEVFCLDWERRRAGHDEVGYVTGIVEHLVRFGLNPPMIYMNANYVNTANWSGLVSRGCPLWVASWGDNDPKPEAWELPKIKWWDRWEMWQYSSTGAVPGIGARVDMNKLIGSVDRFKSLGSRENINMPTSPQNVSGATPSGNFMDYVVVPGDSLSKIAKANGKSWQELYAINRDRVSNPNRIFVGQRIRVWAKEQQLPPATVAPKAAPTQDPLIHVVQRAENLTIIARLYGSTWQKIYNDNISIIGANPNIIKPGQRLVIIR